MQEYCGIAYFRMWGRHVDTIRIILNEEIAEKCHSIIYWKKTNVQGIYSRDIQHWEPLEQAFVLIDEYKKIEYLVDSDKYLEAAKDFDQLTSTDK